MSLCTRLNKSHFAPRARSNINCFHPKCLKITEKVAFNSASEASYVYILSGQTFIKNAKSSQFATYLFCRTKYQKIKCDILSNLQTMCYYVPRFFHLPFEPKNLKDGTSVLWIVLVHDSHSHLPLNIVIRGNSFRQKFDLENF